MSTLDVVVGGNFGSEAKGHMVQRLTERRLEENQNLYVEVVRVAGPNAGHTGYDQMGQSWAFRQLPVAAVVPGQVILGIAAGSEIDPDVLIDEIDRAKEAGLLVDKVIWVSDEATIIEPNHKEIEAEAGLVARAGSTAKGIGAARADRVMRTAMRLADCPEIKRSLVSKGVSINLAGENRWSSVPGDLNPVPLIIEGAQGYGLGVHAGYYPQSTSSDCRAIDFLAMAGINPWNWDNEDMHVWVVARTYPIRVAGNSGPLKGETSWDELDLPTERTTVTQKVRRVGEPDWAFVKRAVEANGPANVHLAVFMLDQMFPEVTGVTTIEELSTEAVQYISYTIEAETGAKVAIVGTGPNSVTWRSYRPGMKDLTGLSHPAGYGTRYDKPRLVGQTGPEFAHFGIEQDGTAKQFKDMTTDEKLVAYYGQGAPDFGTKSEPVRDWWMNTAERHADMVTPKMAEYGSRDLVEIGREFAALAGREGLDDTVAYEVGVFFYLRGKVARWSAAVGRGEQVSQDTLDDIVAYSMMVLHNREEGDK